jgi:hypothetical protein
MTKTKRRGRYDYSKAPPPDRSDADDEVTGVEQPELFGGATDGETVERVLRGTRRAVRMEEV